MLDQDLLDWTVANCEAIAAAAESRPDAAIPFSPDGTMSELLTRMSFGMSGWFTYNISREPDDISVESAVSSAPPEPDGWAARVAHLRDSARRFADLVHATDLDRPVWTFGIPHGRARFWLNRALTETTIRRWDAESAAGTQTKMPDALAAASIDETMRGIWRWTYEKTETASDIGVVTPIKIPTVPAALGIDATDSGARWLLQPHPSERSYDVISDGSMPETVVSGDGHELVLFLWGRNGTLPPSGETGPDGLPVYPGATVRNATGLTVSGDPDVVDAWNFCVHGQYSYR